MFEKIATTEGWPIHKWCAIIQPHLIGKAQKAYNELSVEDLSNFEVLKQNILISYELVPEAYRKMFRMSVKRAKDSYEDFANYLKTTLNIWLHSVEPNMSVESLKQVILLEQFYDCVPEEMKVYLKDKKCTVLSDAAQNTDEYVILHKLSRTKGDNNVHKSNDNAHDYSDCKRRDARNNYSQGYSYGKYADKKDNKISYNESASVCYYCKLPNHKQNDCPKRR